jgi:hypothetical protein
VRQPCVRETRTGAIERQIQRSRAAFACSGRDEAAVAPVHALALKAMTQARRHFNLIAGR